MNTLTLADVSTKLVELESHPGLEHLRRYSPTGMTAQRWATVEAALGQLWEELAGLEELSDSGDITDGLERMKAALPEIKQFLDSVDEINTTVAKQIAPLLRQIDSAGAAVPEEVTDLLAASATDPLSLTADEIERRIAAIAELAAFQANWPEAVAETAVSLDALRDAVKHAAQTRERATQKVLTGPLPVAADAEPKLRTELDSLGAPDPTALRELQRRIASALQRVRQDEALAQGVLDRRAELKGRLRAYAAKAARLGLAQDPDLLSSRGTASGLLAQQPCDLRAVTQAVVDYQQLLAGKRETSR
jgi:chromosome segregation ATPase